MPSSQAKSLSIGINPKTVHRFEEFLRSGLIQSGALPPDASKVLRLTSITTPVKLDVQTAARLSELLRDALVAVGAAVDAESKAISQFTQAVR